MEHCEKVAQTGNARLDLQHDTLEPQPHMQRAKRSEDRRVAGPSCPRRPTADAGGRLVGRQTRTGDGGPGQAGIQSGKALDDGASAGAQARGSVGWTALGGCRRLQVARVFVEKDAVQRSWRRFYLISSCNHAHAGGRGRRRGRGARAGRLRRGTAHGGERHKVSRRLIARRMDAFVGNLSRVPQRSMV